MTHHQSYIDPTAVIEDCCEIGVGVRVWRWTHLGSNVVLGDHVSIGEGCYIGNGVRIGTGSRIQNGAQVFSGCIIGDLVFIGPNVTFTNVKYPDLTRPVDEHQYSVTKISDNVSIGAGAVILSDITIGEGAFIGAGAVVTKSVGPNEVVVGNPARSIKHD